MLGTEGNAGPIPRQIADRMRGRQFQDFNHFRAEFWKEAAADPHLAGHFSDANRVLMAQGKAPFVVPTQVTNPGRAGQVYNLHHRRAIEDGGSVYDLDNLLVGTPLYHSAMHP